MSANQYNVVVNMKRLASVWRSRVEMIKELTQFNMM